MNRELFENYFSGNCSADEKRRMEQWLNENIDSDEFMRLSCDLLDSMPLCDNAESRRAYRLLQRRIAITCGRPSRPLWRKALQRAAAVAAVIAVTCGIALTSYRMGHKETVVTVRPDLVQCYAQRGSSEQIILPDSTSVTLFADSRIIYDRNDFASERRVWLYGDALFDVTKVEGSQFDVLCIGTDIRVLGTRFEVLSHDADENFEVSLYNGTVRLTPRYNGHSDTLRLQPGDVVRIDKEFGTITRHTAPWFDNDADSVVYIGSTVSDMLARLQRRYDKNIVFYEKPQEVVATRLSLLYHPTDSLETVLSAICEFTNLDMVSQGRDIVLKQKQ